jgi:hypothetical protein
MEGIIPKMGEIARKAQRTDPAPQTRRFRIAAVSFVFLARRKKDAKEDLFRISKSPLRVLRSFALTFSSSLRPAEQKKTPSQRRALLLRKGPKRLRLAALHVADDVLNSLNLLCVFVRNLHVVLFFESHNKLNDIE